MEEIKVNENKEDRRTKYTKLIIKESLLELLAKKPINKITVTEVCTLADINRGSFYKYYLDVYDLLEQIERELFDELANDIQVFINSGTTKDMYDFIAKIFESVKQNKNICKILLFSENGNKDIIQNLFYLIYDKTFEDWKSKNSNIDKKTFDYIFFFMANGAISVAQKWIETGLKEKPKEIASIVNQLCESGISTFV